MSDPVASVEAIIARAHQIAGLRGEIDNIARLHEDGELTPFEALHLLAAVIYALSHEDMTTAH